MKRTQWVLSAALAAILSGNVPCQGQDAPTDAGALFQKLDKNGDGKLSASEIPEEQARFFERLVRRGDKNSDGELSRDEFEVASKPEERPNVPLNGPTGDQVRADARQRFEMLDRNKDGKVTLDEVPEQFRERMKPIFDRAGKQELTFEEFGRQGPGGGGDRPEPGELFKRLDTNSDGKLSKDELPAEFKERWAPVLERLGKDELTKEDFAQIFQRIRQDSPGQPGEGRRFGNPEEIFSRMDTNGDGKLTIDEAPERARPMLEGLFRRAGKERDASLTKEEFVKNFVPRDGDRRPEGEQPREGERRPEGERPREGERRPEGDRPREGERRPEGDRPREGERRPEGDRPREGERRPEGERPREGERRPEGDRPREGERRPEGDRPREGERRPEGRPMEGRGPAFFRLLDKNQDGRLSKEEVSKAAEIFDELDRNKDGQLDPAEMFGAPGGPGGPDGRPGFRPGTRDGNPPPRDGDRRPEGAARGDTPRREGDRPEGDRPEGNRRREAEGERGRPEGISIRERGAAPVFQRLDRDGDGKISKDEAPEPMKERFAMLDTNGDGSVSLEEFRAGAQQLGDAVRGRNPEGRPAAPRE